MFNAQKSEIRLNVPESYVQEVNGSLNEIKKDLGLVHMPMNINQIGCEAMAVYKWVVEQMAAGRVIVSTDKHLQEFTQMSTPNLPAPSFNPV
jgi:hypothetical protein